MPAPFARRLPIGAELCPSGTHFRVWAPRHREVSVVVEGRAPVALAAEDRGYFAGTVEAAKAGEHYRFALGDEGLFPDPASRSQPDGPHGPSQIVDPTFAWTDRGHEGPIADDQVIYELHVGTYTVEGTYRAAMRELDALAALGITTIELMPVAEFAGRFGWGYDGVDLFAPTRLYGPPDDLRAFVDAAHARGLSVILDVVYNHLGPDGNYLKNFAEEYFTDRHPNEWGDPLDFDGPRSAPVREFFVSNARMWIEEYHLDGLRLDATQSLHDHSARHVLIEITEGVRAAAAGRRTFVVGENEPQQARLVRPVEASGYGLDAIWNDDFHHSARVATTGRDEAYYTDYLGTPQELLSAIKYGFLFQGQRYLWQKKRRGTPAFDLEPFRFVLCLQNHDQIANSARGDRLHALTSPGRLRAITALLLLSPGTPMLFMGQEFAASAPFLYFADHGGALGGAVRRGRTDHLAQFPSVATEAVRSALADPADPATFERCKLDHGERERHHGTYALHRDLLRLRRDLRSRGKGQFDGAVLGPAALAIRFFEDDRLLIVNLGRALRLDRIGEPLLAPPAAAAWRLVWSSEDPRYGGHGVPPVETEDGAWVLPAEAAILVGGAS
jgi:maltooligosyltrehalose trehalohydrolase